MNRTAIPKNQSSTNVAGSATYTTAAIDTQDALANGMQYLQASVYSSHTGTAYIDACDDGSFTAGDVVAQAAVVANTPLVLKAPMLGRYMRVRYANGATLTTTFRLKTSVTAA